MKPKLQVEVKVDMKIDVSAIIRSLAFAIFLLI